ncbi:MAG: DUF4178 domain-containing protein, partial [Candidatus Acidiferrales bacterium]
VSSGTPLTPGPAGVGKPQVRALNCPKCGAALTLRLFDNAVTIVCSSCHSILDAKDPNLKILQEFEVAAGEDKPLIPLGSRGKLHGTACEVIGFERRTIRVDGIRYDWHEYLLFNPYQGFRYLTEYSGHWNDISVCKGIPSLGSSGSSMSYLGDDYKHFQTAEATTGFVLGEFPWQVRVGEKATVTDYVKPPRVLSSERYRNEVTWSLGEYMDGRDVWKAFDLPGDPPEAIGVYENQPSPMSAAGSGIWALSALFLIILLAMLPASTMFMSNEPVFSANYHFDTSAPKGESSFVTDIFKLEGRNSNVELQTKTNVYNKWIYLNYALINADTGEAWDFGREVSYYTGYDDGYWSEGSASDSVVVPSVPSGNYYLRVEPESDPGKGTIVYSVSLRRDVPVLSFFGWAFFALAFPALIIGLRAFSFERQRWSESDHPPISFNTGSDS